MAYFSQEFISFFRELALNNEREWFHANKKRYEQYVKKPFHAFVKEVIERVKPLEPGMDLPVKNAVFRIYRDIRFSKDKSPYKLHMGAVVSKFGRKDHQYPGIYFQFGSESAWIGGGCYQPGKEGLIKIRRKIMREPERTEKILSAGPFRQTFGELRGEKNKILPKEFKEAAAEIPLLFNKQFYYMAEHDPEIILSDQFADTVMDHYRAAADWNGFLREALT